jgi:hypothetical protein
MNANQITNDQHFGGGWFIPKPHEQTGAPFPNREVLLDAVQLFEQIELTLAYSNKTQR